MGENKPKIFYITPVPPPFGGIAILSKSILEAGLKDKLTVIQLNVGTKALREKINSIRIKGAFNAIYNYFKLFFLCAKNISAKYAFVTGTSNWGVVRDFGFVFILWLFRVKIFLNLHGTRKLKKSNFIVKALSLLEMKMAYKVLSPTKIDYKAAKKLISESDKVHLFYNSTNIPYEYIENVDSYSDNKTNELNMVGIGRLSDAKGTYDLVNICIELIKENYNVNLKWIGRGAYKEDDIKGQEIVNKENLGDRIQFLKDLTEEEKFKCIQESDVFVLPSKNDNLPISILEAMACAKPILSTYMGAIPEVIIPNKNGWLIEPGNLQDLKTNIKNIFVEKNKLKEIGEHNQNQFFKLYDAKNRVNEILDFISNQ